MNLDEPFTSVNWDRGETEDNVRSNRNDETEKPGKSDQHLSVAEEEYGQPESPILSSDLPLDSSSAHMENLPNHEEHHSSENVTRGKGDKGNDIDTNNMSGNPTATNWQSHEGDALGDQHTDTTGNVTHRGLAEGKESTTLLPRFEIAAASPSLPLEGGSNLIVDKGSTERTREAQPSHGSTHLEENDPSEVEQQAFDHSLLANNGRSQEINDQQQMEDAFEKYVIDLLVINPISDRDGNSKLFISYLVTTETNHPGVLKLLANNATSSTSSAMNPSEKITFKVRRRYGDFRFLHDCLFSDFPQLLVPPLPAKLNFKYLTGDTFSTSFVHKRLHSLDRFVTFICQHKLLSQLSVFHYFISDSSEWALFTKNLKILKSEDGDSLIVGKVVNEDLLTETIMNFFTPSKHKKETNKDILEISDKLKKLYENLVKLDRIFSKLNKKNVDLRNDYELFLNQMNKLASLHDCTGHAENGALDANSSFTSSIDATQASATTNFKIFSDSLSFFLKNWAGLGRYIDESFLVSLRDCAKYMARLSSLIELHHNKKIDLQVLEEYLGKAKDDLASIGGSNGHGELSHRAPPPNPALIGQSNGGLVNNTTQLIRDTLSTSATPHIGSSQTEGKKLRLQQKIQRLEGEISAQTQLVNNLTSRIMNEEYPNWDRFNKIQLKKSMSDLCDQEISFYKGLVENWNGVEAKLVKRLEELS